MSLSVKKFSIELPKNGGTSWALLGSSRSGKTTLLKHLYKHYFDDMITVMCSMNPHADIYKDLSKKVLVSNVYNPQMIEDMHKINSAHDNKFPFLFISDDYVDNKLKNDRTITKCLTIYRNAGIHSIFSFNTLWRQRDESLPPLQLNIALLFSVTIIIFSVYFRIFII